MGRAWRFFVGVGLALPACGQRTPEPTSARAVPATTASAPAAKAAVAKPPPPPPTSTVAQRVVGQAPCAVTSCDYRKESCCETETSRLMTGCQKRPSGAELEERGHKCTGEFSADWVGLDCLSTPDCPSGFKCCAFGELTHCAAACEEHEACVPGRPETCHTGSRCEASSSRSGGSCVVAEPNVACGKTRCTGASGCRYDRKKRRSECIALGPDGSWPQKVFETGGPLLRCASPKDCGGERCCAGGPLPMTECMGSCMSGIDVCDTLADCPPFLGPPTACRSDPEQPPFPKTCRYQGN